MDFGSIMADVNYAEILFTGGGAIGYILWAISVAMLAMLIHFFITIRRMTACTPATSGAAVGWAARKQPLWTLFDGSPASARALKVAIKLAHTLAGNLVVLVPGGGAEDIENRKREAQAAADRVDLQYLVVAENRFLQLGRVLAPGAGGLLVLARKSPDLESSAARDYLESLAVPVVLVA